MISSQTALKGVVHGKTIELEHEPGLPDGQAVSVDIKPIAPTVSKSQPAAPWWLARFDVNPAVRPDKFVIKGTRLLADELVERLEQGGTEQELVRDHPSLTPQDLAALREYEKVPLPLRRCFGAWAADAEELDQYLEWSRQQRKSNRRSLDD
jgi:uncharacterized protein (DUF433 family)